MGEENMSDHFKSLLNIRTPLLALFLAIGLILPLSAAQNPFAAAYRVNSAVITNYEIDQMSRLLKALGRAQDNPYEDAVELLINQRLLAAEGKRFNLVVEPVLIDAALKRIDPDGNAAGLRSKLHQQGIADETIDTYIGSQILLRSYLEMRGVKLNIAPEEISSRIMQIPDQVTPIVNVAEIVMPYAEYGGRLPARLKLGEVMDDLRSGRKSFSQIAREISRSPTARNGGRLPPIPRENLTPQLSRMVNSMRPGQVAQPIETEGGIVLLQYVGPSEIRTSLPRNPIVSYSEMFFPANGNLAQSKAQAEQLSRQITNCAQAQNLSPQSFRENVPISSLSAGINLALARMETGESSIFEREDGTSLLFLCNLSVAVPENLQAGVNAYVEGEAMDARARGVMQELRNVANIVKVQ